MSVYLFYFFIEVSVVAGLGSSSKSILIEGV